MDEIFTEVPLDLEFEVEEMTADAGAIVSLSRTRVQELTDIYEDAAPQFAVLRVRAGAISGNGNHWPDTILADVSEQINRAEPLGYFGHIRPEDRGYTFPDPQTIWLGSKIVTEGGKPTLYVKGYLIPKQKARAHVQAGILKTASWAGKASGKVVNGVRMIEKFALESIDWARPGANGMDARVVAVVSEQEGSEQSMDLSKVTIEDIERENPSLMTLLRQKVEGEHSASVTEMKEKADKADEAETVFAKLRKLLKIDETADVITAVAEAVTKVDAIGTGELRDKVAAILADKVKNPAAQKTLLRLMPVTEMAGMDDDELKQKVEDILSTDDDVKAVVTEMEQGPAPLSRHRAPAGEKSTVGGSGMVRSGVKKL